METGLSVQQHIFPIVVFLFAIAIGIELRITQFVVLFSNPRVPILGTIVHTITFPLIAIGMLGIIAYFQIGLDDYLILGILLVAACPSGGFSNLLVLMAKADLALSVTLTSVSSVLSFITVPFFFWIFSKLMPDVSGSVELPIVATLVQLIGLVIFPVGVGML